MTTPARAPDMNWVMPYIIVEDAREAAQFYCDAFGFELALEVPDESGKIVHAEVRYHDMVMMCGSMPNDLPEEARVMTPKQGGFKCPMSLFVYVEDVDGFFERIQAHDGVMVLSPPEDQFWGDRMCRVLDPNGHVWAFASWLGKTVDPADLHTG